MQRPFRKIAPIYAVVEELSEDSRDMMNNVKAKRTNEMIHGLIHISIPCV